MARETIPGRIYMITRRCTQRQFLLRPDGELNNAFVYCFAYLAQKYGIEVISLTVMSNHYHAVVRDVRGNLPSFTRDFHGLVARCINVIRGRWESLWAGEQTGMLHLADERACLELTTYTVTNAVKDHLVDKVTNWPGVCSYKHQLNQRPMHATRPRQFFKEDGKLPETVTLHFSKPALFAHLSHDEWTDLLRRSVDNVEARAQQQRQRTGRRILGRRAILRQRPTDSPSSASPRRKLSPRRATKNKWLRIELSRASKAFRTAYRDALDMLRAGIDVIFPYGTYQLVALGIVRCAPAPAT